MGTYLSETRSLSLNLLEPKRYCLPGRRIFLQLPVNCKNFCLNNKQKHFVYIIKCGESLLPISQKTDDPDLQPLLGLTGECGGDNSCCPSHCWPCQLSVLLTGADRAIHAGCSATLICSHIYPQLTSNFHLHIATLGVNTKPQSVTAPILLPLLHRSGSSMGWAAEGSSLWLKTQNGHRGWCMEEGQKVTWMCISHILSELSLELFPVWYEHFLISAFHMRETFCLQVLAVFGQH